VQIYYLTIEDLEYRAQVVECTTFWNLKIGRIVSSSLQSSLSFLKLGDWRSGTAAIHWDEFGRGKLQYFRQLKNHRLRPKFSKDEYSSIECIVFPWLEPGAGLEGLGVGVVFDSTDLFGHRMLPQLRGFETRAWAGAVVGGRERAREL